MRNGYGKDGELQNINGSVLKGQQLGQNLQEATKHALTETAQEVHAATQEKNDIWGKTINAGTGRTHNDSVANKGSIGESSNSIINSAIKRAVTEATKSGSGLNEKFSTETQRALSGFMEGSVSGGILGVEAKAGGRYEIRGVTSDNRTFSHTLTGEEAKAFERAIAENLSAGIQNSTGTEGSITNATIREAKETLSKLTQASDKVSKAEQRSEAAQKAHEAVSSLTAGGTFAIETHGSKWAQEYFGFEGADGQLRTQEKLREMATNDPKALQELIGKYIESFGIGEQTKGATQSKINEGNDTKLDVLPL